jgi:hypothetical protein
MDSRCFISLCHEVQGHIFNTLRGSNYLTDRGNIFLSLWLKTSVAIEKKLLDFAGSFNTSTKPWTLLGFHETPGVVLPCLLIQVGVMKNSITYLVGNKCEVINCTKPFRQGRVKLSAVGRPATS